MKIFAIIVIYNGMHRNWIQKCFDSVLASSVPAGIIAIDNGSSDGSIDYIKTHYPTVDLIASDKNLGFARANNIGLKKAIAQNADYVFLLNQDAWLTDNNTLEKMMRAADKNQEYGIISPIHLSGDGIHLDKNFDMYTKGVFREGTDSTEVIAFDFINAAAWLISRKTLHLLGGFNTDLFHHYGEDDNFVQRLKKAALKIGVLPHTYIIHDRKQENKSLDIKMLLISHKIALTNPNLLFSQRLLLLFRFFKLFLSYPNKDMIKGYNSLRIYRNLTVSFFESIFKKNSIYFRV